MTFDNQLPNHETFRCVACPGPAHLLPSFLNFKDVRIHAFKDHMVTMERGVKASTLLPTTLTIFMCKLCPEDDNKLFLTEELMKTHLVKHSNFFAARWKLFSELHCRVCEIVIDQDSDEDHMSSAHSKALFADIDDAIGVPDTNSYESQTIVEDLVFELVGLVCKEEEQIQNKEPAEVKVKTEVFDDTEVDSLVDKLEDKNQCFRSSNSVIVGDGEKKTPDLVHDSSPLNSLADVIGKAEVSSSSSSQKLMLTSQGGLRLKPLAALFDQNKLNIGEKRKATKKKTKKSNAEIIMQVSASDVSPPGQGGSLENSQCLNCLKFRADCGQCRVCSDRSLIGNFSDICLKRRVVEKCEKLTGGTYRTTSWISEYCHKHEDVIKINKGSEANQISLLGIKKWVSAENIKNYISENGVEVSEVLICNGNGKVAFSNEEDALIWNSKDIFIIHDESIRINKCHIKSLKPENKLALLQSRKLHKLFVKGKPSPFLKEVCYIGDTQLLPNEEAKGLLRNKENTLLQDKTNDFLVKEDMLEIFSKKEKAKDENKDGDTRLLPNEEAKGLLRNKENALLQDKTNDLLVKEHMLEIFSKKEKAKDENKDDHYSEIKEDGSRFAEAYRRDSSRSQTINTRSQSEVGNRMEGIGTRGGCRGKSKSRCNVRERSRNSSRDRSRNRSRDRSRNRSRYRSRNRSRDRRKFRDLSNRSERKWSRDRRSTSRRSRDRIRSRERRSRERRSRVRRSRERRSRERRSRDRSRSRDRHRSRDRRSKERRRPRDRRRSRASMSRDTNRSRSRIMEGNNNKRKRSTSKECFEAGLGEFLKNIRSSSGQVGN